MQKERKRVGGSYYLRMIACSFEFAAARLNRRGNFIRTPRSTGVERRRQLLQSFVERIEKYQAVTTKQRGHHARECFTITATGLPCIAHQILEIRNEFRLR